MVAQPIRHCSPRFLSLAGQYPTKKSFINRTISAKLHENIKNVTILINGTPEIMLLTANRHKELIEEPMVAERAFVSL